jgi:hypothetical protein
MNQYIRAREYSTETVNSLSLWMITECVMRDRAGFVWLRVMQGSSIVWLRCQPKPTEIFTLG